MGKEVLTEIDRLRGMETRVLALAEAKKAEADGFALRSLDPDELVSSEVLDNLALRYRTESSDILAALRG